jgi:hypothetical protein
MNWVSKRSCGVKSFKRFKVSKDSCKLEKESGKIASSQEKNKFSL